MRAAIARSSLLALAGALAARGAAGSAGMDAGVGASPDSGCFNAAFATGYQPMDSDTLRVGVGPDAGYDLDLSGPQCREIGWTHQVAFASLSSSWVCVGGRTGQGVVEFRDPSTGRPVQCRITAVRRVDPPRI